MNIVLVGPCPENEQITTKDETGLIDLRERSAKQSTSSMKLDSYGNIIDEQDIETTLIDDKLYNKLDGQWTMSVVSDPTKSFDERNKLKGIADLISGSNIEMIGTETIDGQKCYEVKVKPELSTLRNILAAQASSIQSSAPIQLQDASSNDLLEGDNLLQDSNVSYTVWLTVDKCIPKKMDAEIAFTLAPASMDVGLESVSNSRVEVTVKDTLVLSDFDAPGLAVMPY